MAFEIINPEGDPRFLLLCDHASNALPDAYGDLGLGAEQLTRHIAWDVGAADVVRHLAASLNAPAILARYSRLLIDLNRDIADPTLIMQISDGAVIEGNRRIDEKERAHRIATYYTPYHDAVTEEIDRVLAMGKVPVLVSIHSFTEKWKDVERPWHLGLLWDKDGRVVHPLMEIFQRHPDLVVGDNQPYSGELRGDCMYTHGTLRGLPHVLIEIRQDLIRDPDSVATWAGLIEEALKELIQYEQIWAVRHFGSKADAAE